ncbi:hypothetical protein TorRG33x02_049930 [Trema orientale]|uniref:Uncharacterized protein n=1 Tax=Trema orientale TaxID=63057 RepID=A0A2P5FN09_TREOI|nr:hypothetical protein TorRG33x02_049930 [Trema orientale]
MSYNISYIFILDYILTPEKGSNNQAPPNNGRVQPLRPILAPNTQDSHARVAL